MGGLLVYGFHQRLLGQRGEERRAVWSEVCCEKCTVVPPLPAGLGRPDHFFRSDSGPAQPNTSVSCFQSWDLSNHESNIFPGGEEREYKSNLISTICTVSPAMDTSIERI